MKKLDAKSFVLGLLLSMLITSTTIIALASTGTIDVIFDGIKVYIQKGNNERQFVEKPNILYEGVTYVPLRAISEMFGYYVDYDNETQSAVISDTKPSRIKSVTENDPLSIVEVNGKQFKKYQDIAYLLKYKWFSAGLFGLELTYGYDDYDNSPYFTATNKMPYGTPISKIYILGYDMTNNRDIVITTPHVDFISANKDFKLAQVIGINNPRNAIENAMFITQVRYEYLQDVNGLTGEVQATYNFENETLEMAITVLGHTESKIIPLTYDVLKNR